MKELFAQFQLSEPWILVLALLLPLFWLRRTGRSLPVILWRCAIFLLLVLVLAGPELVSETSIAEREERIFVFDFSRSVPASARAAMARAARENFGLSTEDRTIVFGGKALEVEDLDAWIRGERAAAAIQPEQTNLEEVFSNLLARASGKLYLFTDGWETQGDLERLLPSLRPAGLKVFPVVPARQDTPNVAVRRILAPHQAISGESVQLRVMVENYHSRPVEGTLTLKRNGRPFKEDPVTLSPGSQMFSYQSTLAGESFIGFEAAFSARDGARDLFPQDNQATAWIAVQSKEKVLLVNGQAGGGRYIEELLRRRGFEVTSAAGESPPAPAGFGLVIFNNIEREKFSSAYLSAVERHTAAGNAFLMVGGDPSFGPAGYKKTPIEAVLPVEIKEPPKKKEETRAVVLVIDKSGSMREDNRILYAQEAAKSVFRQLRDRDFIGVVGFDISAFVVVPLSRVDLLRGSFASQVDRLKPGGRTYLMPGVVEGKRQLERQTADRKHVIILSDGETGGTQGDYIDLVNLMRGESKITISAVAIGNDANIPLLKRIAQYGGGFFHHTYDPRTLPRIISQQMREKPEEAPPPEEEKPLFPFQVRGSEILNGFSEKSYPPIRSYVETELKQGARLDLMISQQQRRDPLLASWRYGAGKAVAFTTDLQGGGTRDWLRWGDLERFWNAIFNWLRPPKETLPPHEIRINLAEDRPLLDFYAYAQESADSVFRYRYTGKGRPGEGTLKRLAPGHFQTSLPFFTPGDYRIEITEEARGQKRAYPTLGYTLHFSPRTEVPRGYVNLRLLEKLAEASGGRINPDGQAAAQEEKISRAATPLRSPMILLIAVLFLLEFFMRRFVVGLPVNP